MATEILLNGAASYTSLADVAALPSDDAPQASPLVSAFTASLNLSFNLTNNLSC